VKSKQVKKYSHFEQKIKSDYLDLPLSNGRIVTKLIFDNYYSCNPIKSLDFIFQLFLTRASLGPKHDALINLELIFKHQEKNTESLF
jgi:hypothetical protein